MRRRNTPPPGSTCSAWSTAGSPSTGTRRRSRCRSRPKLSMGAKVRDVRLGPTDVVAERRPDGVVLLRSPHELGSFPKAITHKLDHWASVAPDRVFLAQREGGGAWEKFTYAEVREGARRVAQALIDRDLSA